MLDLQPPRQLRRESCTMLAQNPTNPRRSDKRGAVMMRGRAGPMDGSLLIVAVREASQALASQALHFFLEFFAWVRPGSLLERVTCLRRPI
jgi:hypothetical protein